ncbi:hypothetical protein ACFW9D_34610 [Streptomyces sp. NPDC059524]|uniref:hypothetical protein n=1 Tax=Streptomyces sp. NPDC059524 TaxID=3346856 RepID=UPI00368E69C7
MRNGRSPELLPATHSEVVRGWWFAPLLSSVVTLLAGYCAFGFAALAPMACDACTRAQSDRFDASFYRAIAVFFLLVGVAVLLLTVAWALPHRERAAARFAARRTRLAVAAPAMIVVAYLVFLALVDWP